MRKIQSDIDYRSISDLKTGRTLSDVYKEIDLTYGVLLNKYNLTTFITKLKDLYELKYKYLESIFRYTKLLVYLKPDHWTDYDIRDSCRIIADTIVKEIKAFKEVVNDLNGQITKLVNDYNWQLTPDVLTAAEVASILSVDGRTVTCEQVWCDATFTAANTQASNYKFGWLFDKTLNCVENGCYTNDNDTYGWWTKNDSYRSYAINVGRQMMGHGDSTNNGYYGVRPYVTISKSVFEK